ncbi:MAG: hypothetical protein IPF96_21300 [Rhodobacter sp.]|nr:hypothetical protein [Rhodobacter sp.]
MTLLDVDYSRSLTELEAAVLPSRIRYMFYETLTEQAGLDGLCGFLGVSPQPAIAPPDTTAALPIPTRIKRDLRQALEPVYAAMRARFGADLPGDMAVRTHRAAGR